MAEGFHRVADTPSICINTQAQSTMMAIVMKSCGEPTSIGERASILK